MRVTFSGKSTRLTEREREYAERKLQRLSRYFKNVREAHVTHDTQRNFQIVEVLVDLDGTMLRAEERTPDVTASIDAVVDKLEHQVSRLKDKLRSHKGRANAPMVASALAELAEPEAAAEEQLPTVVRRKRFAIKPMTVDEACLQIDMLSHDFFAFVNAETEQPNVLYRRRDGNFGLLELDE